MFDQLFTTPSVIEKYQAAPLAQDRLRYLLDRAEKGASNFTLKRIAMDQFRLVHLLNFDDHETVNRSLIEAAADERSRSGLSLSRNSGSRTSTKAFIGQSVRWLRHVGRFEEDVQDERHTYTAEIEAYKAWMREDRGLSEATITCYCRAADDFMAWLSASNVPLNAATIVHVDRAIVWKVKQGHYSRSTINNYARRIRAFLVFGEHRGWCNRNTAAAIIPPRVYPDRKVPLKLSRDDLQRLLATTDGARPVDIPRSRHPDALCRLWSSRRGGCRIGARRFGLGSRDHKLCVVRSLAEPINTPSLAASARPFFDTSWKCVPCDKNGSCS